MKEASDNNISYLDARNLKVNAIKEAVKKKMILFGSDGRY